MDRLFVIIALVIGAALARFLYADIMSGFTAHGVGRDVALIFVAVALIVLAGVLALRRR